MIGYLASNIFSILLIVGFLFYSYRVNKLLNE